MKTLLIIDDEVAVHSAFQLALEDHPVRVLSALSGEDGLNRFHSTPGIDLVILDLKMPGINGVETLRRLRVVNADVPVHIITAFSEEYLSQLSKLAEQGIEFELARKPLERKQIIDLITSLLDLSPRPSLPAEAVQQAPKYLLRLYVAGETSRARRSIENIRRICNSRLEGSVTLDVIDILKNPTLADGDQIIATPTLIKVLPEPIRRIIGDFSAEEHVLIGLDIKPIGRGI